MRSIYKYIQSQKKKMDNVLDKHKYNFFITHNNYLSLINNNKELRKIHKKNISYFGGGKNDCSDNLILTKDKITIKLCKLNTILQSTEKIMKKINTLKIEGTDKTIGSMSNNDLLQFISKIPKIDKDMKFNTYNPTQMKTIYNSYYSLQQNFLLNVAFRRNLYDGFQIIADIITDLNAFLKQISKSKSNKEISSLKQSINSITNNLKQLVKQPNKKNQQSNSSQTTGKQTLVKSLKNSLNSIKKKINGL